MTRIPRHPTCPTSSVNYAASMGAQLKLTTRVSVNTSECNKVPPQGYSDKKFVPAFWNELRLQQARASPTHTWPYKLGNLNVKPKRAYEKRAKHARGTPQAKATPTTPRAWGLVVQGN